MKNKLLELNEKLNRLVTKKNIVISLIVITILLLIPIIWLSFYSVPALDDFSYGLNTMQKKGFINIIIGSFKTIKHTYFRWQGTYSAIFIFTLNPAILDIDFYFLTTIILIAFYFIGLLYISKNILYKGLKLDKKSTIIVLLLFFLLCIETMIDKTQGLYWWNGASYYIIFFSLELVEIALLSKIYWLREETTKDRIILLILNFIIAGGNFIISLQQLIILAFLNLYLIIQRKDKTAVKYLLLSTIGFLISIHFGFGGSTLGNSNSFSSNFFKFVFFSKCLTFVP